MAKLPLLLLCFCITTIQAFAQVPTFQYQESYSPPVDQAVLSNGDIVFLERSRWVIVGPDGSPKKRFEDVFIQAEFSSVAAGPDSTFLIAEIRGGDKFITKLDVQHNVIWTKKLSIANAFQELFLKRLGPDRYLVMGVGARYGVWLLDGMGNIQVAKQWVGSSGPFPEISGDQGPDGDLFFNFKNGNNTVIMCLDSAANLKWQKRTDLQFNDGLVVMDTLLYVYGSNYSQNEAFSTLLKLSTNGVLLDAIRLDISGGALRSLSNNQLVITGQTTIDSNYLQLCQSYIHVMDQWGDSLTTLRSDSKEKCFSVGIDAHPDGGWVFTRRAYGANIFSQGVSVFTKSKPDFDLSCLEPYKTAFPASVQDTLSPFLRTLLLPVAFDSVAPNVFSDSAWTPTPYCNTATASGEIISRDLVELGPNPVVSTLHLEIPPELAGKWDEIQIVDAAGKQVYRENFSGKLCQKIDVSGLPGGLYFVGLGGPTAPAVWKKVVRQ